MAHADICGVAAHSLLPAHERSLVHERIARFEGLLLGVRAAINGPGGGDETRLATLAYAHLMLVAEIERLRAIVNNRGLNTTRESRWGGPIGGDT